MNKYCREDLLFLAASCEKCKRYTEMRQYVRLLIAEGFELSPVERHLFSIAYKNIMGELRISWRSLKEMAHEVGHEDGVKNKAVPVIVEIESEICSVANEVLDLITNQILPSCTGHEGKVYFLKLQGDYQRYMTEISSGKLHEDMTAQAYKSYKSAADLALTHLPAYNSTRLGLMMNLAVFYYDVYNSPERACLLSKTAYDDAIDSGLFDPKRVAENGDEYNDSLEIIKMLRNNLRLWTRHFT